MGLSVKFGAMRGPDGAMVGVEARPAAVQNFLTYLLQRLGVDHVDVYRPARLDPAVPIEDTVGAIVELVEKGYARHVGLSEVGTATLRRAAAAPISDLQIEYSLLQRDIEDAILPTCRELGIGITAYGVLGRGLIGGSGAVTGGRVHTPRFQGEHLERNRALVARLEELAAARGCSVAQLAVGWVGAQGEDVVPVVGARRVDQVTSLLDEVVPTADELARIDELVPRGSVSGDRYPSFLMAGLDSER